MFCVGRYRRRRCCGLWEYSNLSNDVITSAAVTSTAFLSDGDITKLNFPTRTRTSWNTWQHRQSLKLHSNLCFFIIIVHIKPCPTLQYKHARVRVRNGVPPGVNHYKTKCFTFNVYSRLKLSQTVFGIQFPSFTFFVLQFHRSFRLPRLCL